MATWEEFCKSVNKFTNKATAKISDIADTASLRLKLTQTEAKLSEAYEDLGRLTYKQLRNEFEGESKAKEIIAAIDELDLTVQYIKNILKTKKEAKEDDAKEAEAEKEASEEK